MFAVMYRWTLVPDEEARFRAAWRTMTEAIRARYGTQGSRLHRTSDGDWLAYAVWPSRDAWESAGTQPPVDPIALDEMKACIARSHGAVPLEVVDDLLR